MRRLALTTVLSACIAAAASASASAAAAVKPPTGRQIAAAVSRAERSADLWATINNCGPRQGTPTVGVRGQMPSLGFPSDLSMTIQLNAYSSATNRFVPIDSTTAVEKRSLGVSSSKLEQWGWVFVFPQHATGRWNATVTFTWTRAGKMLGKVTRQTSGGHPNAADSDPPRYTAADCTIS